MWHISGSCCEQYFYLTHILRLICQFGRADDAVYPSGLKVACFRLFVPSKLAVVLFAEHCGFFPQGNQSTENTDGVSLIYQSKSSNREVVSSESFYTICPHGAI